MANEIDAPLVAHDEELAGDTVYDLRLNHVWRRIVGGILLGEMEHIDWQGTTEEIEQAVTWFAGMVRDLYDETFTGDEMAYVGAKVGRTTDFTAPILGTLLPFEVVLEAGSHDTDGFFDIASPTILTIPAGLGGYYYCYARVRWIAGVTNTVVRILITGGDIIATDHNRNDGLQTQFVAGSQLLVAGQSISLAVRAQTVTRIIRAGVFTPYGAILGLYRVGIV